MVLRAVVFAIVAVMVLQGCQSCPKCGKAKRPSQTVLTVRVTPNQEFAYKGNLLTAEEFFEQAEFAKDSRDVTLDVAQESQVDEKTIIRAIAFLQGRGYSVTMGRESKYKDLIP